MAGGIRAMSIGRGVDPREVQLIVSGGAGPLFVSDFGPEAQIRRAIIPRFPGVTNAVGCAKTDLRNDYTRTLNLPMDEKGAIELQRALEEQLRAAVEFVSYIERGNPAVQMSEVEMHYVGQTHTVRVQLADDGAIDASRLIAAFHAEYRRRQGMEMEDIPIVVRALRTTVTVSRGVDDGSAPNNATRRPRLTPAKSVGAQVAWFRGCEVKTALYERALLRAGETVDGPALIQQTDSTTWVAPGSQACVDHRGNLLLDLAAA
jgi:N-methylhydantoinase A